MARGGDLSLSYKGSDGSAVSGQTSSGKGLGAGGLEGAMRDGGG